MTDWKALDAQYFMDTGHRRLGVVLVRGQGTRVWDDAGKAYLDFLGGWAVTALGHSHPVLVGALKQQAERLLIGSADVYTIPQIELAELLLSRTPFAKAFFANSGAEANEAAMKLARIYEKLHLGGAYEVISALNSFHGRTLAMVAATGKPEYQAPYTPLPDGFVNVPYDDIEALKGATTDKTCAVFLEPIQGEGGVIIPSPDYFKQVREWCDERGILLIMDEVQTGCGRTGTLFHYEQLGVEPDIMTIGKGMGGGVPVAGVLVKEHAAVFGHGDHGSTYGGSPLTCAVALANLRHIIQEDLPDRASRIGEYLMDRLRELGKRHAVIKEVRGRGLLIAVEFDRPIVDDLVRLGVERGLLLNPNRPTILRLMPPLNVTTGEIGEAVGVLDEVLDTVSSPVAELR